MEISPFFLNLKTNKPVALLKENAQVTSINFLQSEPYDYYVSSGLQINRYSRASNEVIGSITKLKQPSLCSHLRRDGQLLVSGDLSGELKVWINLARLDVQFTNTEIIRCSMLEIITSFEL